MANSIYQINKGINKPIEFKGLKAQYIWYLGIGILGLLIVYASLYVTGVNQYLAIAITGALGAGMVSKVYGLSNKYGEHGMMKVLAKRSVPKVVKSNSRNVFRQLTKHSRK
jgi:hypothetical protein